MYAATALVSLFASMAIAAPAADLVARQNGLPEGYAWPVENWHAGCARGGCNYNFNVTGIKDGYLPGFKAYCSGYDSGFFSDCELLEGETNEGTGPPFVAAKLRPSQQDGNALVSVSLQFQCDSCSAPATYNMTGSYNASYNAFVAPLLNFNITPDTFTAVA